MTTGQVVARVLALALALALVAPAFAQTTPLKKVVPLGANKFGWPRYDISDGFNEYEGGFDVTSTNYLASAASAGLPGFVIGILLIVVMVLMLLVKVMSVCCGMCCKTCSSAYKPRKFTSGSLKQQRLALVVLTLGCAIGCIVIYSGGPKLTTAVNDTTATMVNQIDLLSQNISDISKSFQEAEAKTGMDLSGDSLDELDKALAEVKESVDKNAKDIKDYMAQAEMGFMAVAAVTLVVALFAGVFAFFGKGKLLLAFLVLGSIVMVLCWIFWGVTSIVTVVVDDLCTSMARYLEDPLTSDLGSVIPCLDAKAAVETMNSARKGIYDVIETTNTELMKAQTDANAQLVTANNAINTANALLPPGDPSRVAQIALIDLDFLCTLYKKLSLSALCSTAAGSKYGALACKAQDAFSGDPTMYPEVTCPSGLPSDKQKNEFKNFNKPKSGGGYKDLQCPTDTVTAACAKAGQPIGKKDFDDLASKMEGVAVLLTAFPKMESLIRCDFVTNAFTHLVNHDCDPLVDSMYTIWSGFVTCAVFYFALWVTWIVAYSRAANPDYNLDK